MNKPFRIKTVRTLPAHFRTPQNESARFKDVATHFWKRFDIPSNAAVESTASPHSSGRSAGSYSVRRAKDNAGTQERFLYNCITP